MKLTTDESTYEIKDFSEVIPYLNRLNDPNPLEFVILEDPETDNFIQTASSENSGKHEYYIEYRDNSNEMNYVTVNSQPFEKLVNLFENFYHKKTDYKNEVKWEDAFDPTPVITQTGTREPAKNSYFGLIMFFALLAFATIFMLLK